MSSIALARKWRPRSFASLVGQQHVVKALTHALDTQRIHHAYLLTGTRGVGKTTIARILAKSLNCEVGMSATPCGVCSACTGIDSGHFPDYMEMDAASNRGVDEMAQVLDSAVYAPTSGRYKVFVIDEVHMLTNHAFNSMLKTLEEPPAHVVFILATTDPQKVPVTVLSRCLQFGLKNMPVADIMAHLSQVLTDEQISFEPAALAPIGKAARGSMRDALSLLDQAIAYGGGKVLHADVRTMLGAVDSSDVVRLMQALAADDGASLLSLAPEWEQANVPLERVLQELAALAHRIALVQRNAGGEHDYDPEQIALLAQALSPEYLQVIYQIALHGARDMSLAPDELTGFSMTLVRLLAFRPQAGAPSGVPASAPSQALLKPAVVSKVVVPVVAPRPSPAAPAAPVAPPAAPAVSAQPTATAPAVPVAFDGDWPALTAQMRCGGMVKQVLLGSELVSFTAGEFRLRVPLKNWAEAASVGRVRDALSQHFGHAVRVVIEHGVIAGPTAESLASEDRALRQAQAEESIQNDGMVRTLLDEFNATIVPGSIKPPAL
jgi:DNA polymerase III subunit gamma/tau